MARTINAATLTELANKVIRPILLLEMNFDAGDGGPVRYWNGIGDFVYDSNTYTGAGGLARITTLKEDSALRASGTKFELSGIPSAVLSLALTTDYQDRTANLWFALVDSSLTIVGDTILIFSGRMDVMEIEENGETATVAISVEHRLIDLERPKLKNYTHSDQQELFASDLGLELVAQLNSGIEIVWGP